MALTDATFAPTPSSLTDPPPEPIRIGQPIVIGRSAGVTAPLASPTATPARPSPERTELATVGCGRKVPLHTLRSMLTDVDVDGSLARHTQGDCGETPLRWTTADGIEVSTAEDQVLLHTVDVVLPMSLTPADWGRVVALHCVSDIYAAGGSPLSATGILQVSQQWTTRNWHVDAYRAAITELRSLGVPVVGGHTLRNPQTSMGFAITGVSHQAEVRRRHAAAPGDVLVLTKRIGGGLVLGGGQLSPGSAYDPLVQAVVDSMLRPNREHSAIATALGVRASTDVTGYGLLGSCLEIADSAGVAISLRYGDVPVFDGVGPALRSGIVSPLAEATMIDSDAEVDWPELSMDERVVLCDPQVSGGLLLSMSSKAATEYCAQATAAELDAWIVGEVHERDPDGKRKIVVHAASSHA